MGRLLIWCSGATPKILNRCPTERPKYLGIGAALLITSIFAAISMTFALNTDLGTPIAIAIVFAIAWGLAILSLDRWLIASLQRQQHPWHYLILVLPRLSLAILLGVVISTPFVLEVFESDINHQLAFLRQASASSYYALEASSPAEKMIASDQNNVTHLEVIIASGGSTGVEPSSDPEYRELLSRLNSDESQQNTAYRQWQCLLKGSSAGSCQAGGEQAATASHQEYLTEVAAVKQDSEAVQSRQQQILKAASQASNSNLEQATAALPAAKNELAVDQAQQRQGDASFNAANNADNGLFARLQALDQAAAESSTLNTARWLLILLISIIEILPILVKVLLNLGPENTYEKILDIEETMIVRAAREDALRRQSARSLE
jgi:Domain of unknown function (DUF4407)